MRLGGGVSPSPNASYSGSVKGRAAALVDGHSLSVNNSPSGTVSSRFGNQRQSQFLQDFGISGPGTSLASYINSYCRIATDISSKSTGLYGSSVN